MNIRDGKRLDWSRFDLPSHIEVWEHEGVCIVYDGHASLGIDPHGMTYGELQRAAKLAAETLAATPRNRRERRAQRVVH